MGSCDAVKRIRRIRSLARRSGGEFGTPERTGWPQQFSDTRRSERISPRNPTISHRGEVAERLKAAVLKIAANDAFWCS